MYKLAHASLAGEHSVIRELGEVLLKSDHD